MPRAKKDGQHLNCYIDRTLRERLDAYAEEKGQTLTMAIERLLTKALDNEKKLVSTLDTSFFFSSNTKCGIERNDFLVALHTKVLGRELYSI